MFDPKFEPLRQMEAFTEDMFNRIIAFQEKEHAAWNTTLDFKSRIKGLPLHNLIFSNPDRNPEKQGPTVAHYYPLHEEIHKIAQYAKQVSTQVCDYYPYNGFIGSLLANEGLSVTGLQDNNPLPNQIEQLYDPKGYHFSKASLAQLDPDIIFMSWLPSGANPDKEILQCHPKLLIYIYTDHINPQTGQRQTGSDDMFDGLDKDFELLDSWDINRPRDLLHEIWPDMTPNIEEKRSVRVYQRQGLGLQAVAPQAVTPYDWEQDLNMALLALEAKNQLKAQGIPL